MTHLTKKEIIARIHEGIQPSLLQSESEIIVGMMVDAGLRNMLPPDETKITKFATRFIIAVLVDNPIAPADVPINVVWASFGKYLLYNKPSWSDMASVIERFKEYMAQPTIHEKLIEKAYGDKRIAKKTEKLNHPLDVPRDSRVESWPEEVILSLISDLEKINNQPFGRLLTTPSGSDFKKRLYNRAVQLGIVQ